MNRSRTLFIASVLCAALVTAWATNVEAAKPKEPRREILGIELDMKKEKAEKRLRKIATFERNDRRRQEIWKLRDNRKYTHLILAYDMEGRVRYVTAVADENGERVRYSDVADINLAKQDGNPQVNNFNYIWEVAARGKRPRYIVSARGRDPQYLTTYSVKRLEGDEEQEAN